MSVGMQRKDYLRLLVVPVVFGAATCFLWFLFSNRPALRNGQTPDLHFPKSLEDLRELVRVSSAYKSDHWYYVLLLFSSAYIYKQTFAIPGSALLIHENENQLFLFLISLRVFPMTPNWLLNIIAPYVNVQLPIFFLSVFFGLIPYNFLCIQAGGMLAEIQSLEDIFTPRCILGLMTLAMVMLTISHFARKRKQRRSD